MLQDCKYRLPCNWCDKYDRMCEAVLLEIYKQEPEECEHDWRYEGQLGNIHHYKCVKCDTLKAVPLKNLSSTDEECEHNWEPVVIIDQGGLRSRTRHHCSKCGKMYGD